LEQPVRLAPAPKYVPVKLPPPAHLLPTFATFDASFLGITLALAGSLEASDFEAVLEPFAFEPDAVEPDEGVVDVAAGGLAVVGAPVAGAAAPEPWTVITDTGFLDGALLLERPMRTPTPMASSSVPTPAMRVPLAVIRGRRRAPPRIEIPPELGAVAESG
jgi:hypothetical protein